MKYLHKESDLDLDLDLSNLGLMHVRTCILGYVSYLSGRYNLKNSGGGGYNSIYDSICSRAIIVSFIQLWPYKTPQIHISHIQNDAYNNTTKKNPTIKKTKS